MRIVIKVGTNVLTREDTSELDHLQVALIVRQIAELQKQGREVILVSSGAVAAGRAKIKNFAANDEVEERQLLSAIGQIKLMEAYRKAFDNEHIICGQILAIGENLKIRRHYLTHKQGIEIMLRNNVLPIVNENDTLSLTDLMFADNDDLAKTIATMIAADKLIILSSVDGIYDGDLREKGTKLIPVIKPHEDISGYANSTKTTLGRGGMHTKIKAAKAAAKAGIEVIIANGKTPNILLSLLEEPNETPHTKFEPHRSAHQSPTQNWIANSGTFSNSRVYLDLGASAAIRNGKSILMVGVTKIEGTFEKNDIVKIFDQKNNLIAYGKSSFDSTYAHNQIGKHRSKPIVHTDYLQLI